MQKLKIMALGITLVGIVMFSEVIAYADSTGETSTGITLGDWANESSGDQGSGSQESGDQESGGAGDNESQEPGFRPYPKKTTVYAMKHIYLYRESTFNKKYRKISYVKKPRIKRPMFVVVGHKYSRNGVLRYKVRDVNHKSKTDGKVGYITARWDYIRPVYYQGFHKRMTVIAPAGINVYKKVNLTKKRSHYKQGTKIKIKRIVHYRLTTRYILASGGYITGNRKLVQYKDKKQPMKVKTKTHVNLYDNVNLQKKRKSYKAGTKLTVKNWDYSREDKMGVKGVKRYKVAGGYITGNTKFVKVVYSR